MMDQPTCGRGLAENAALPAKLAELTAALAEILELHRPALDLDDASARQEDVEDVAYRALAAEAREAAARLQATAERMAASRDLPMGAHDVAVLAAARNTAAFRTFVQHERALLALLQQRLKSDQAMLAALGAASDSD